MRRSVIEFWFDFASTYSWLSAVRIEALAQASDCAISWRPFLLGPIFKAQGWTSSPFNLYPAKGRYMVRDISRIATARQRAFVMPDAFPANSLAAARLALAVGDERHRRLHPPRLRGAIRNPVPTSANDRCWKPSCSRSDLMPSRFSPRAKPRRSRTPCAATPPRHNRSASSAHRHSSPPTGNCSGATTGSSRRSPGRAAKAGNGRPPVGQRRHRPMPAARCGNGSRPSDSVDGNGILAAAPRATAARPGSAGR